MFYVFKHGRAALQRIDWRLLGRGSRDWGVQISHGEAPLNRLNSRTGASSRGGEGRGGGRGIRSGRGVLAQVGGGISVHSWAGTRWVLHVEAQG